LVLVARCAGLTAVILCNVLIWVTFDISYDGLTTTRNPLGCNYCTRCNGPVSLGGASWIAVRPSVCLSLYALCVETVAIEPTQPYSYLQRPWLMDRFRDSTL